MISRTLMCCLLAAYGVIALVALVERKWIVVEYWTGAMLILHAVLQGMK